MLNFIRENNEIVVIIIGRLGRNSRDIFNIIEQIKQIANQVDITRNTIYRIKKNFKYNEKERENSFLFVILAFIIVLTER